MTYQYTKREDGDAATSVVGPFGTVEDAREAIVRELVAGRPRMRRGRAERFADRLSPLHLSGERPRRGGATYSIEDCPHVPPHVVEEVRRKDAVSRREGGVALVHLDSLLAVMGEHVPEYLIGEERDAYVEALCDIPIHVSAATMEYDAETGALRREPVQVVVNAVQILGSRQDRTGAWGEP